MHRQFFDFGVSDGRRGSPCQESLGGGLRQSRFSTLESFSLLRQLNNAAFCVDKQARHSGPTLGERRKSLPQSPITRKIGKGKAVLCIIQNHPLQELGHSTQEVVSL